MALAFPNSPATNDTYSYGGVTWRYDGSKWVSILPYAYREKLAAARSYYVATTGSDSNDGLSAGAPFLTVQKAVDVVSALDTAGYAVTINVADGTYTGAVSLKSITGGGKVTILGNKTTPANVLFSVTASHAIHALSTQGVWGVEGIKFVVATSGNAIYADGVPTRIQVDGVNFGAVPTGSGMHMMAVFGAVIDVIGNYAISGPAYDHISIHSGGIFACNGRTITITGTPAFTLAFAWVLTGGSAIMVGNTYSGSATGSRYNISLNGLIRTDGGTLPGDSAGTTATGGQYT